MLPLSHDVRRKGKRKPYTPSDHLFSRLRLELRLQGGAGVVQVAAGAAVSCGLTSSAACVLHMQAVIASSGYAVARWKSAGLRPAWRGVALGGREQRRYSGGSPAAASPGSSPCGQPRTSGRW